MKNLGVRSLTSKVLKIVLSGTIVLSTTFTLTGCDSTEKEPTDEVVEERELTPLEQEISELEDYQFTDKI